MDPETPAVTFTPDSPGCGLSGYRLLKMFQKGGTGGGSSQASPTVNLALSCSTIWTPTRDHTEDTTLLRATGSSFPRIVRSDPGKENRRAPAVHLAQPTIRSVTSVQAMTGPAAQRTLRTPRPLCSGMILLPFFQMEVMFYKVMACFAAKAHREIVESSVSLHGMI